MKEDILEQIVNDYLNPQGCFTMVNVRFTPTRTADGYGPTGIPVVSAFPTDRYLCWKGGVKDCSTITRGLNCSIGHSF